MARGAGAIAVTLGAAGCTLYRIDKPPLSLPGHAMRVADTIGAGDTFSGALAAALARGQTLEDALSWANAAAALSVTASGAIGGMPSLEGVAALLAT